jgi:exonuclease SbcC
MLKIYSEFNSAFQNWFDNLIEDDTITARLDESFTPIVIQNGQITTFNNLSGGEKTSLSLAYRLALNKVINEFLGTVHTRDLLILDEPTDGFSGHQLDKLRDVLELLDVKQLILVSHEPKLESFATEIVRVEKSGHISQTV